MTKLKKFTIDLDHTMAHCERFKDWHFDEIKPDFEFFDQENLRLAFLRPYLRDLLYYAFENYDVYVCSAAKKSYVESFLKQLGVFEKLSGIITQEQLQEKKVKSPFDTHVEYVKLINDSVVIDDKPYVIEGSNNLIFEVSPYWYNYTKDCELLNILNKLKEINQK